MTFPLNISSSVCGFINLRILFVIHRKFVKELLTAPLWIELTCLRVIELAGEGFKAKANGGRGDLCDV